MTVLALIQSHCRRNGLQVPTTATGSTDTTVIQLLEILRDCIDEIITESDFEGITYEVVFTAIAAESQGLLTTLAGAGFQFIRPGTFWNRSQRIPVYGPATDEEWQSIKAVISNGPNYTYRIRGGYLLLNPAPSGTLPTLAFEYVSKYAVTDSGGAPKTDITADNDLIKFPDNMMKKALSFRWKREKGLPYQADQAEYMTLLNRFVGRQNTMRTVNVGRVGEPDARPTIIIPSASILQ